MKVYIQRLIRNITKRDPFYYELSKQSDLSKWSCFNSLSTKQEEYARKCIGILEHHYLEDDPSELILDWIKKGYKVVWRYAITHKVLSLTELFRYYLGKRETYTLLELQNLASILVFLQDEGNLGTEWDNTDPQNHYMTESFENFISPGTREIHIKGFNKDINIERIDKLRKEVKLEEDFPNIYTFLDQILRS